MNRTIEVLECLNAWTAWNRIHHCPINRWGFFLVKISMILMHGKNQQVLVGEEQ